MEEKNKKNLLKQESKDNKYTFSENYYKRKENLLKAIFGDKMSKK